MARKETIQIRCSSVEKERWTKAAGEVHLELSPWIRLVLERASTPGERPLLVTGLSEEQADQIRWVKENE